MKLEIKKVRTKKELHDFYDELLYIGSFYKKIKEKPTKKVSCLSKKSLIYLVFVILLFIYTLICYKKYQDQIFLFMLGFVCLLLIFAIIFLIIIKKRLNFLINQDNQITIEFNQENILYKDTSKEIIVKWSDIKYVIINKNTISFLPNKISNIFIIIDINYKSFIMKALKEYTKLDLLIDNTNLYKK